MAMAKKYSDRLGDIKCNIEDAYEYFRENYNRYNEFIKFVFVTSLTDDDISLLKTLLKPQIECNILAAYVARLRGEFSKQEPSVIVTPDEDSPGNSNVTQVIESHFKQLLSEANKDGFEYKTYGDVLAGGFSVAKVITDYKNSMSFKQCIKIKRVFDPTLCGFDPLAMQSTKYDGNFSFEIYPKSLEEFESEYPDINVDNLKYRSGVGGFNWSYKSGKKKIILVADYYEKKTKSVRIVELSNGSVMEKDKYKKKLDLWNSSGLLQQPPQIVNERDTQIETIDRYVLIEDQIIKHEETDFKYLPHIFIDGDSVMVRDTINGEVKQVTRPYVMHAKGIQKLKNFSMQSLANELENMVQHKVMLPVEGVPNGYEDAYTQVQIPNTLLYNQYKDNDPNVPLNPPTMISRTPIPQEVTNTIGLSDQMAQSTLGSYDAQLGIQDSQLSGIAIQEGATQSNSASMPYVVGYLQGLTQIAQIVLDLIPKYYVEERNLSIKNKKGDTENIPVNGKNSLQLAYGDNAFHVNVEAGVSFAIQKSRALQQLISLTQASPIFGQFINQEGLEVLVDNLEIRGADRLKEMAQKFMQQMQKQAQMQSQQPNPQVMKTKLDQQKLQQQSQKDQSEFQLRQQELQLEQQNMMNDRMKIIADNQSSSNDDLVQLAKSKTERMSKSADLAIKAITVHHGRQRDIENLSHKMATLQQQKENMQEAM